MKSKFRRFFSGVWLVYTEVFRHDRDVVWSYFNDELTGLLTRRAVYEWGIRALRYAFRQKGVLSIVYLDVDYFKRYNDELGHDEGDRVLACFGKALLTLVRPWDLAGRIGGDEFLLVLPETDAVGACSVVRRLRWAVPYPFSAGICTERLDTQGHWSLDELIHRAETMMREDKKCKSSYAIIV